MWLLDSVILHGTLVPYILIFRSALQKRDILAYIAGYLILYSSVWNGRNISDISIGSISGFNGPSECMSKPLK